MSDRCTDWIAIYSLDPDIFRTIHIPSLRHRLSSSAQVPVSSDASHGLSEIVAEFRPLIREVAGSILEDAEVLNVPVIVAPVDVKTRRRPPPNKRKREERSDGDDDDDDFVLGKPSTSTSSRKPSLTTSANPYAISKTLM